MGHSSAGDDRLHSCRYADPQRHPVLGFAELIAAAADPSANCHVISPLSRQRLRQGWELRH